MAWTKGQSTRPVDGGAIFPPRDGKRNDKSPDFRGTIELSSGLLDEIMQEYKKTGVFKIALLGYKNVSHTGGAYLKLIARKFEPYQGANSSLPKPNVRSVENEDDPWS